MGRGQLPGGSFPHFTFAELCRILPCGPDGGAHGKRRRLQELAHQRVDRPALREVPQQVLRGPFGDGATDATQDLLHDHLDGTVRPVLVSLDLHAHWLEEDL